MYDVLYEYRVNFVGDQGICSYGTCHANVVDRWNDTQCSRD